MIPLCSPSCLQLYGAAAKKYVIEVGSTHVCLGWLWIGWMEDGGCCSLRGACCMFAVLAARHVQFWRPAFTSAAMLRAQVLDGEKILSRKRGFTVNSCATVLSVAEEDAEGPRFQGLPVGEKVGSASLPGQCPSVAFMPLTADALFCCQVRISDATLCSKAEGSDLRPACATSCETTCRGAMGAYTDLNGRTTGIEIEEKDVQRVVKSCIRDCRSECVKPGKVFDFVVPSRR